MTPANYWKLGLFIVVSLATGLGLLAFLGAKQIRREVEEVHFFFNQTVDGLSVGSEIRMRGIPIGRVTGVGLAEDRIHVHAKGEIRVATMQRLGLQQLGIEASPEEVRDRIQESGLRAFLEQNILTGVALINNDYFEGFAGQFPEYPFPTPPRTIPTAPSAIKGILVDMESIIAHLRKDLPGLLERFESLLVSMDGALVDMQVGNLSSELQKTLQDLRTQTDRLVQSMGGAIDNGQSLLARLGDSDGPFERFLKTYRELGEELRGSVQSLDLEKTKSALDRTLGTLEEAGDGVVLLSDQLREDLGQLGRTLESAQRLMEVLEQDPSSILRGRSTVPSPLERKKP